MKKKYRFFFTAALIFSLITSASAHTGGTDSNGGHTDSETGEYHYHHGYPAHDHYDMDGDGDIDCPYDFVDATDHSVSSNKSSGTHNTNNGTYREGYTAGEKHGYEAGYEYGYERGYAKGESSGWITGYEEAQSAYKTAATNAHILSLVIGIPILLLLYRFLIKRRIKQLTKSYEDKYARLNKSHTESLNAITRQFEAAQNQTIAAWKEKYQHERSNVILLKAALGQDRPANLPDDITMEPFFTPVKGESTKEYPYGKYTIFMTRTGKKYHCDPNCVYDSNPYHFFDLPTDACPCYKCVPKDMYPQPLPEWCAVTRKK